jgi:hypothetical protein
VEDAGREEDLEVVGWEESFDGGQEDSEEEEDEEEKGHEEGAELDDEAIGVDGSASRSASTHRFRSSHLIHPPIATHVDNSVIINPCGDR